MVEIVLTDVIFAIVNFIVLIWVLNKFLHKPILNMLDQRKTTVKENLNSAETSKQEAEQLKAEYQEQIKKAKEESSQIISEGIKLAEKQKNEIVESAKVETQKIKADLQREIQAEKDKAMSEVREVIVATSLMAAEKIIAKNLDAKDHEKMIDDFIKEVGEVH